MELGRDNYEEANYIDRLQSAYRSSPKEFQNMLRNDSPVATTINIFENVTALGAGFIKHDLVSLYKVSYKPNFVLYHSVTSSKSARSVLNRINQKFFGEGNRFGKRFYASENPEVTVAEIRYHGSNPTHTIKFRSTQSINNILDLTNPRIAEAWNYNGGEVSPLIEKIGILAKETGFNGVMFQSERAVGKNIVFFQEYNKLQPQMIIPYEEEVNNEIYANSRG